MGFLDKFTKPSTRTRADSNASSGFYKNKSAAMSDSVLYGSYLSAAPDEFSRFPKLRRKTSGNLRDPIPMPAPPRVVIPAPTPTQPPMPQPSYQLNYAPAPAPAPSPSPTAPSPSPLGRPAHLRTNSSRSIKINVQYTPQAQAQPQPQPQSQQYLFPSVGSGSTYIRMPSNPGFTRRRTASDAADHRPDPAFLKSLRGSKEPPTAGPTSILKKTSSDKNIIKFYDRDDPYYEFTNFAPFPVEYGGQLYPTSEHLFQARKFMPHRMGLAEHIRSACGDRSTVAFSEARRFAPEVRSDWRQISIEVMEEVLELKFKQHKSLRRMLVDTGDAFLIENAGRNDAFWGNGADGQGRNELGLALMRLRQKLRGR